MRSIRQNEKPSDNYYDITPNLEINSIHIDKSYDMYMWVAQWDKVLDIVEHIISLIAEKPKQSCSGSKLKNLI